MKLIFSSIEFVHSTNIYDLVLAIIPLSKKPRTKVRNFLIICIQTRKNLFNISCVIMWIMCIMWKIFACTLFFAYNGNDYYSGKCDSNKMAALTVIAILRFKQGCFR